MMNKRILNKEAISHGEIVIGAAITYLEYNLSTLDESLVNDAENTRSFMTAPASASLGVAREEISRLRDEKPKCYEDAVERLVRVVSLLHCIANSYDMTDTAASRCLKRAPAEVETILSLIETMEVKAA